MSLRFAFDAVENEVSSFRAVASSFLDPSADQVIGAWLAQLRGIRRAPDDSKHNWSISSHWPLKTLVATRDQNARDPNLLASVCTTWQVQIPRGVPRGKQSRSTYFDLYGVASTQVSLWQQSPDEALKEMARWSFELGDDCSPGCHFHIQVKGEPTDRIFPDTLSIPRLPGILVTAIDAIDFVLGEVFQEVWRMHVGKETDDLRTWARFQRGRLLKVLEWQRVEASRTRGACWNFLKHSKPQSDLFV